MTWIARVGLVLAGYAIVSAVMLAPLSNYRHLGSASYEGDARLTIWTLAWSNHVVLDRVPSLFDANIFYPAPKSLAYGEHMFGISLFTLPIYALTRNPVLAYNVVWLLSFLLSGLATHRLAWSYTRDHLAAFVAGSIYAFGFFKMLQGHGHLHIVWAFWIPLSILALERWYRRPEWRRIAMLLLIVVPQALASWYLAVMILLTNGLGLGWLMLISGLRRGTPPAPRGKRWLGALQLALALAVGFAVLWPFARHYDVLAPSPPMEAKANSADVAGYLVPPEDTLIGRWLVMLGSLHPRWIWGERTLYLGYVTLALAAIGVGAMVRNRRKRALRLVFFLLLGVVSLALSFGPSLEAAARGDWGWSPFGLFARLPGMELFRAPARFALLVTLSLSILAAVGARAVHVGLGRGGRALTLILIPLLLSESYVVKFPGGPPEPHPIPEVYRHLATIPSRAVVSLPDHLLKKTWFHEPNYLYYSTAHWHPIVNGASRGVPAGYARVIERVERFPLPDSASALRELKVEHVVLHAEEYPDGATRVGAALGGKDFALVASFGQDHLFRVVDQKETNERPALDKNRAP